MRFWKSMLKINSLTFKNLLRYKITQRFVHRIPIVGTHLAHLVVIVSPVLLFNRIYFIHASTKMNALNQTFAIISALTRMDLINARVKKAIN